MTRSSNTDKTHRLNAAFNLLAQGYPLAEAAEALTQQFGLSRRQAYRYLQEAQEIDAPGLGRFTVYPNHHQNTCGCREATSVSCASQRHDHWRDSGTCHRQFSRQAAPPWLIAIGEVMKLSWNLLLIVCMPLNWSKSLPFWCRTGNAELMNPQN